MQLFCRVQWPSVDIIAFVWVFSTVMDAKILAALPEEETQKL
jgi:hypothetical protein